MDVMTTSQVANYYETDIEAIQKCYQRNREEIDNDGVNLKSYKDFLIGHLVQLEKFKGKVVIHISVLYIAHSIHIHMGYPYFEQ